YYAPWQFWAADGGRGVGGGGVYSATTTIRYKVNEKTNKDNMGSEGIGYFSAPNAGINSIHSGGANVLRADGSVIFLSDSTAYDVIKWMAIRDDGQALTAP